MYLPKPAALLIINITVVLALSFLLPNFQVKDFLSALFFIILLTILNWTVVPVLKILTFPLNFLSFGLVYFLINLLAILIAADLLTGVNIQGNLVSRFLTALIISVSLSLIQSSLEKEE